MASAQTIGTILPIATDCTIDQARTYFFKLLVSQTQTLHDAWTEAFQHHIGLADHALKDLAPLFCFEIEGDAALVAIDSNEIEAHATGAMWRHKATIVTGTRFFNFNDIGPKIGEYL